MRLKIIFLNDVLFVHFLDVYVEHFSLKSVFVIEMFIKFDWYFNGSLNQNIDD